MNFDLWSAITVVNGSPTLDDLKRVVDQLPVNDRAALTKHLLGENSGVTVVVGNHQLSGNIVIQINSMDKDALSSVLAAIAVRISEEAASQSTASEDANGSAN
jgi:hypothetical protein